VTIHSPIISFKQETQLENSRSPWLYLVPTIILWSAVPAIAKLALNELNNFQLLFYASIVSVFSLFVVNLLHGRLSILATYSTKDFMKMFLMGGLGLYLYMIFLYASFSLAPAGQANVINYLWPVFIIIFSVPILKDKFNYKTIVAILISFFGAVITFTGGSFSIFSNQYALGYLLAALGAACYGLFCVLGKKLEYEKFSSMLMYYVGATILIILTTIVVSEIVIPKSIITIISVLALGGVMNSLAFVFWFKALQSGHTHRTANVVYVVPFLAMVWTYLLNAEPLSLSAAVGLTFILTGIFIQMKNEA
jgi:drug/metabolite transporter (DMT)-like permease